LADDGSWAVIYMPGGGKTQVAMNKLRGPVAAKWFDSSSGQYKSVEGSLLSNEGNRDFATPGKNAAGDSDWVLVLEVGA